MFTLACKRLRQERNALLTGAGCLALALLYQAYGHGVGSLTMTLCWLPSVAFAAWDAWMRLRCPRAPQTARRALGAGMATLTVGMFLQGILEIAGTDSPYLCLFYILGAAESVLALGLTLEVTRKGARA